MDYGKAKGDDGLSLVNLEYLKENFGDDIEFQREMLTTFMETVPDEVDRLAGLVKNQEWNGVRKVAHSVKSSISLLGNRELSNIILKIEQADSQKDDVNELMVELRSMLAKVYQEVNGLLNRGV